jgi:hypothetical protein
MEDDADADVQSERDENFIREAEEENPKRNAKGKFGGVAKVRVVNGLVLSARSLMCIECPVSATVLP